MKKPDITKGEWRFYNPKVLRTYQVRMSGEFDDIVIADSLSEEDAKTISAVPEMIDALIWCYDFIQELKDHGIDNWSKEQEVLEALKKAGCTE